MKSPHEILQAIEESSHEDQLRILYYMVSATELAKDIPFLKRINKLTFGLLSKSQIDEIPDVAFSPVGSLRG